MTAILKKFTSRKFLAALASILIGAANLFGADGDTVKYGVGAGLILVGAIAYIVTEGKLDLASIASLASAVSTAVSAIDTATDTAATTDSTDATAAVETVEAVADETASVVVDTASTVSASTEQVTAGLDDTAAEGA